MKKTIVFQIAVALLYTNSASALLFDWMLAGAKPSPMETCAEAMFKAKLLPPAYKNLGGGRIEFRKASLSNAMLYTHDGLYQINNEGESKLVSRANSSSLMAAILAGHLRHSLPEVSQFTWFKDLPVQGQAEILNSCIDFALDKGGVDVSIPSGERMGPPIALGGPHRGRLHWQDMLLTQVPEHLLNEKMAYLVRSMRNGLKSKDQGIIPVPRDHVTTTSGSGEVTK